MLDEPVPLSSRYSYHTIFSDICKTRFNHLATRLSLTFTFFQAILIAAISGGYSSTLERFLMFPLRFLLLYLASLFIVITRKNYLHVQYRGYSNLLKSILGQIFCVRSVVFLLIHSACSFSISLALSDCLGLSFGSPSHKFIQCYRLYVWVLIPMLYTLQHSFFDLDRLSFSFETHFQPPQQYIASSLKRTLAKCAILTVAVTVISPFIFVSVHSYWFIGFIAHLKLMLLSFLVFFNLEFINVAFNAHMSIGCLHKGKPISSLSSTPMETLITGLTSKKLFTKLTAFQELSYRATSSDLSLRLPIYHTRYRNTHIWPVILRECLITIQETNESVTKYLKTLENSMKLQEGPQHRTRDLYGADNEELFGNQATINPTGFPSAQSRFPGSPPITSVNGVSHRITLKEGNVLLRRNPQKQGGQTFPYNGEGYINALHSYDEPIITHDTTLLTLFNTIIGTLKRNLSLFFFPSAISSQDQYQQLSIIEAWCISKRRQAEKLVPLPVCHAECIVSLMGLLINAIEEDPKGGVVSSVGEVLKCLERSVGALGRFADWNPDINKKTSDGKERDAPDVVSILYDLSVSAFLEIVLKYNVLLNDLYLDDDVVKLSRWVLDICGK